MACDMSMTSSPTPAVLPEARALVKRLRANADPRCNQHIASLSADAADMIERLTATLPASDAAVPAGEWSMIQRLRDEEADSVTILCDNPDGPPNAAVECCGFWTGFAERRFEGDNIGAALQAAVCAKDDAARVGYPDTAAAPKVASDTGAGLREAITTLDVFLAAYASRGDMELVDRAVGDDLLTWGHLRAILAALATDADGATGGGEVPCDFWLGDCRRCGKRADRDNQLEPCARPRGRFAPLRSASSLGGEVGTGWVAWNPDTGEEYSPNHPVRSGECVEAERIRPSTPQEDVLWQAFQGEFERAHALETQLATTPGGDLLEQAARVAENVAIDVPLTPGCPDGASIARNTIAAAIRALSARNQTDDGGAQ